MDLISFIERVTWKLSGGGITQMSFNLVHEKTFDYSIYCDHKNERFMLESDGF